MPVQNPRLDLPGPTVYTGSDPIGEANAGVGQALTKAGAAIQAGHATYVENKVASELDAEEQSYANTVDALMSPQSTEDIISNISGIGPDGLDAEPVVVQNLLKDLAAQKRAGSQGYLSADALALKKEVIVRKYLRAYPSLQSEISNAVARSSGLGGTVSLAAKALDDYQKSVLGMDDHGKTALDRVTEDAEKMGVYRVSYATDVEWARAVGAALKLKQAKSQAEAMAPVRQESKAAAGTTFRRALRLNTDSVITMWDNETRNIVASLRNSDPNFMIESMTRQNNELLKAELQKAKGSFKARITGMYAGGDVADQKDIDDAWSYIDPYMDAIIDATGTDKAKARIEAYIFGEESLAKMRLVPGGIQGGVVLDMISKLKQVAGDTSALVSNKYANDMDILFNQFLRNAGGNGVAGSALNPDGTLKEGGPSIIGEANNRNLDPKQKNQMLGDAMNVYIQTISDDNAGIEAKNAATVGVFAEIQAIAGLTTAAGPKPNGQTIDLAMKVLANPKFREAYASMPPPQAAQMRIQLEKVVLYGTKLASSQAKEEILAKLKSLKTVTNTQDIREAEATLGTNSEITPKQEGPKWADFVVLEERSGTIGFFPRQQEESRNKEINVFTAKLNKTYGDRIANLIQARANVADNGDIRAAFEWFKNAALAGASEGFPKEMF